MHIFFGWSQSTCGSGLDCVCSDVDECADPSQCPGQMCVNALGSYRCVSCRAGYTLINRQCTGAFNNKNNFKHTRTHTHKHAHTCTFIYCPFFLQILMSVRLATLVLGSSVWTQRDLTAVWAASRATALSTESVQVSMRARTCTQQYKNTQNITLLTLFFISNEGSIVRWIQQQTYNTENKRE